MKYLDLFVYPEEQSEHFNFENAEFVLYDIEEMMVFSDTTLTVSSYINGSLIFKSIDTTHKKVLIKYNQPREYQDMRRKLD